MDVKHAVHTAELIQLKGQDFSEETNSLFISACLRGNDPEAVVKHFTVRKNRLSAWTSPVSLSRLLQAILDKNSLPESFLDAMKLLRIKGVYFNDLALELLSNIAVKYGDDEFKLALNSFISEVKAAV